MEQLSAAAIRHGRLSGPLVRRLSRAEPLDGVRAISSPWRGPAFLARPSSANWMRHLLQTGCAIWVISLVLRVTGLAARPWHRISIITWLSLVTALPFLSSALLTDIFAGVGVLALYLLIYHQPDLR